MNNLSTSDKKRFWAKVNKKGPIPRHCKHLGRCWLWTASLQASGYGQFIYARKFIYAHRASYLIHFGSIKKGLYVLHHCDNPSCVNPKHLFGGTQKDNIDDMIKKGREAPPEIKARKGEEHGNSILTNDQIRWIRDHYVKGSPQYGQNALSRKFNIRQSSIWLIVHRKAWKHVR